MPRTDDPTVLSPDQRFCEVARLLAVGLRRLLAPSARPGPASPKPRKKLRKIAEVALRPAGI
jgi:hypothetical protein